VIIKLSRGVGNYHAENGAEIKILMLSLRDPRKLAFASRERLSTERIGSWRNRYSRYFPSGLTDYEDVTGSNASHLCAVFPYALAGPHSGRDFGNHRQPNSPWNR
jgi:hypothetical protein